MTQSLAGFRLESGLRPEHRADAARLYWMAFGQKLGKLLGPEDRALAFFKDILSSDRVITAVSDQGMILGLAGYKQGGRGFSDGNLADLLRHYGWLGVLWRVPLLVLLERNPPAGILQMDGICVDADARGKGVGTALLNAIIRLAEEQKMNGVTLDVIDTNPRAEKLYLRLGFKKQRVERLGPLAKVFGFKSSLKMLREI